MTDTDPILERLLHLHPKLIDLTLERVLRLLDDLGRPQASLPPVVHVSGTNGKGSVTAMMRAALEAAGYRVHVYTSPHLVRFNERIRLAGTLIGDDELSAVLTECEDANRGRPVTFFEITTAAAFVAFSRTPADVALLETGLGGRLDATNVIEQPALSVITPVSVDHQQYLGETLVEIAAEKAGILKPGVTCVVARQDGRALTAIEDKAAAVGAPLLIEGRDWTVRRDEGALIVESGGRARRLAPPSLVGPHQEANAGAAAVALERLAGFEITDAALSRGLGDIRWPARLQRLERGPLADRLGAGFELWLDGGHNQAAGDSIAQWLAGLDARPLDLVLGMIESKDPVAFLGPLKPHVRSLRTLTIPGQEAAFSADALAALAETAGIAASPAAGVAEALDAIARDEPPPARVLITGSLYLCGAVLAESGWNALESGNERHGGTP